MKTFYEYLTESPQIPSNFALTLDSLTPKNKDKFDAALITLKAAMEQGSIRKTDLDNIKSVFNNSCEATWEKHYQYAYLNQPRDVRDAAPHAKEEEDIYYKAKNFRNMDGIIKKYSKFANTSQLIGYAIRIASEYASLKDIMDHLATNIVKGKAPSLNIKPINPNQVRGTCGWCLRDIAIDKSGLMSHHGFTRPGVGYQTQSCAGVNYKNLEVSRDGLKARIKVTEQEKSNLESRSKDLPKVITLNVRKTGSRDIITIGKEDPNWSKAYHSTEVNLESEIRSITKELEQLNQTLIKWEIKTK
jgi:hypothetical protein